MGPSKARGAGGQTAASGWRARSISNNPQRAQPFGRAPPGMAATRRHGRSAALCQPPENQGRPEPCATHNSPLRPAGFGVGGVGGLVIKGQTLVKLNKGHGTRTSPNHKGLKARTRVAASEWEHGNGWVAAQPPGPKQPPTQRWQAANKPPTCSATIRATRARSSSGGSDTSICDRGDRARFGGAPRRAARARSPARVGACVLRGCAARRARSCAALRKRPGGDPAPRQPPPRPPLAQPLRSRPPRCRRRKRPPRRPPRRGPRASRPPPLRSAAPGCGTRRRRSPVCPPTPPGRAKGLGGSGCRGQSGWSSSIRAWR
jgi:hypothetical protein